MDRDELEARADRARRRGEVAEAVAIYEQLVAQFPDDGRLREKLTLLSDSLQPMELHNPKAAAGAWEGAALPVGPEQEGERLFAIGDYAGAAAAYRRALAERPESPLVRERLEELYSLARAAPASSPTDAALPAEPEARLQALLDRIASRRRVRAARGGSAS